MKKNMKIDPGTNYLISPLLYFIGTEKIEQLNKIETSGFFVGLTYCFFCSCYLLFSILCRGVLSQLYLFHTGYRYHLHNISFTDVLAFVTVTVYCVFYIYACIRVPEYYEAIEQWGELIEDPLILTFNANLHNFNKNSDVLVSVRFWPFIMVSAWWIYFLARLQMHRGLGSYVIMIRLATAELIKFLLFWIVSLAIFASVTVIWFGEFQGYTTFGEALESLCFTSFGLKDMPIGISNEREGGFMFLHGAFMVINIIGFLSFLTAMMT